MPLEQPQEQEEPRKSRQSETYKHYPPDAMHIVAHFIFFYPTSSLPSYFEQGGDESLLEFPPVQADYEEFMADSSEKRAQDSRAIAEKEGSVAQLEAELQEAKDAKKAEEKELLATQEYLQNLHGECDWLMENYDLRKSARLEESEALKRAKAVLSGADFTALVQLREATTHLRMYYVQEFLC